MGPPFTREEFFEVFAAYNQAIDPLQSLLLLLAVTATGAAFLRDRRSDLWVGAVLGVLWVWMGTVYHWVFFTRVNPAAWVFGALFVLEGGLLLHRGIIRWPIRFRPRNDVEGWAGALLILYALALYPLLGRWLGHVYPRTPTFGAPCPTTIFTYGLLLWAGVRVPWRLLIVPGLWSLLGISAAVSFGVGQDWMLPVSAAVATTLIVRRNRRVREGRGPHPPSAPRSEGRSKESSVRMT